MNVPIIEIQLDIPDVRVLRTEIDAQGDYVITVESTQEWTRCHRCGRVIHRVHGHDREITLRHLPILGRPVYIHICPKRFECLTCEGRPTTTQTLPWHAPRSPHTRAYETSLLLQLVDSTVAEVSRREGLGYEAVMGTIDRSMDTDVDWNSFQDLDTLGLDEISLKKGHQNFVTIVTSRSPIGQIRLVAVLKDRKKATVKAFFLSIPKQLRKTIRTVCSDLYDGFINGAREILGQKVHIVADRFHVAKLYRKGLDTLRKKEMKRLKKALSQDDYQELRGVMWLLRKKSDRLTADEQKKLKTLFKHSPALGAAYIMCEQLTHILDEPLSRTEGENKLRAWKELIEDSALTCFDSFLVTLDAHMEEIANYFIERKNSGFVEGLNNKIKIITRRCYGIFNIKHLFQRITISLEADKNFAFPTMSCA